MGRAHSSIISQTNRMLSDSSSSSRSTIAESERKSGNSAAWLAQPAVALFGLSFLYASLSQMMTRARDNSIGNKREMMEPENVSQIFKALDIHQKVQKTKKRFQKRTNMLSRTIEVLAVGPFIGLLILLLAIISAIATGTYYIGFNAGTPNPIPARVNLSEKAFMDEISLTNMDATIKYLSRVPHISGSPEDLEGAQWVQQQFLDYGLDEAKLAIYDTLLSFPNRSSPNQISLIDANGQAIFSTSGKQPALYASEESSTRVIPNFNAYSGPGPAEGELVYVHYGLESDFDQVANLGINVTGRIVLARYGLTFRGNIASVAEKRGAAGVLFYSDPKDFAQQGPDDVYPNSWWMPEMATQLGTLKVYGGDPSTPYYPSIKGAYRIPASDMILPKIPVQPISYSEAQVFLAALNNDNPPPAGWVGGLNASYSLGPKFTTPGWKVKMIVHTQNEMSYAYNVIATLRGEEEPDRYVLLGNHRDAWIFGALDPISGTAALLEIARVLGKFKRRGWRPRRTILFCNWGAEEYGLVGSYEWAEEHLNELSDRAVAYLNVDYTFEGNFTLAGSATPLLQNLLIDVSKRVPNPDASEVALGRSTVFDTWLYNSPDSANPGRPIVSTLGFGSDYVKFMQCIGVPSVDLLYTYVQSIGSYPLYHTLYETHYMFTEIMDKGLTHTRAIAQLWGGIALNLSTSVILPMDVAWYGTYLTEQFAIIQGLYNDVLVANNATLSYFQGAVNQFVTAAETFTSTTLQNVDTSNVLAVRQVNDQLFQLERYFIDPKGLPNRPQYNHIVFAPSSSNAYSSSSFSGLTDLLNAVGSQTESQQPTTWAQIKQHLSVIAYHIGAAAESLSSSI